MEAEVLHRPIARLLLLWVGRECGRGEEQRGGGRDRRAEGREEHGSSLSDHGRAPRVVACFSPGSCGRARFYRLRRWCSVCVTSSREELMRKLLIAQVLVFFCISAPT